MQFQGFKVWPIAKPEDMEESWTINVDKVLSSQVCAVLCLDHDKANQINAWQYQEPGQLCNCGWIESMECPEQMVASNLTLNNRSLTNAALGSNVFVQLEKTVSCGKPITSGIF